MQLADKPDFEKLMRKLCGGLNEAPTEARIEAFWDAFGRMGLHTWRSLVSRAMGPEGIDELTTDALWACHRALTRPDAPAARSGPSVQERLCDYAARRGGYGLDLAKPWTYIYRESGHGNDRSAECVAVDVPTFGDKTLRFTVADMQAQGRT